MITEPLLCPPKQPVPRSHCVDCRAYFARHRAVRRMVDTIVSHDELELLVCPECGSYTVEDVPHETR